MDTNEIKVKILELESNLENSKIRSVLSRNAFALDKFKNSLQNYRKNIDNIEDTALLSTIASKVSELVSLSNEALFGDTHVHRFTNAANFLFNNTPTEIASTKRVEFPLSNSQNELLENLVKKSSLLTSEFDKLQRRLEEIEEENKKSSTTKEQLSQIAEASISAQKEFEDAKNAAVDFAKLEASVSYWDKKQEDHRKKFWRFVKGAFALFVMLVVILSIALYLHNSVSQESKQTELNSTKVNVLKDKNVTIPNVQELKSLEFDSSKLAWYVLMIFISSSIFWAIRITVKIALSNLHLSEDANERVVMIQTYLSFVKEGEVDEEDKKLILSSLFRSSNIGIISDESSVTVADIITAFKK